MDRDQQVIDELQVLRAAIQRIYKIIEKRRIYYSDLQQAAYEHPADFTLEQRQRYMHFIHVYAEVLDLLEPFYNAIMESVENECK